MSQSTIPTSQYGTANYQPSAAPAPTPMNVAKKRKYICAGTLDRLIPYNCDLTYCWWMIYP
jgi:hypothetical protein